MSARCDLLVATGLLMAGVLIGGCSSVGSAGNPAPEVSVSNSDGSIVVGEGSKLPSSWPRDVPAPDGLPLQSAVESGKQAVALYLGPGDAARIGDTLKAELIANGFRLKSTTGYGGETVATFTRETIKVDVTVGQTGTDASITITVEHLA